MDYNSLITQVSSHFSVLSAVLLVLLITTEVVANVPFIKSNSLGQMVVGFIKNIITGMWPK
jgi:hypothetical protein